MRTDDTRSASPALLKFQNYLNKAELLTEITLAPLDPASSSQLCRAWLGRPMTSELHERLYAFTEGNPYFLFQTLYSLAERRILIPGENPAPALAHTATQQQLQVPTSVRQAISLRTETLPAKTKDILNAAAVMGRQFGPALVQRVAGVTEAQLDRALSQLCERQIIVARENAYDFRHGMTREAVYAGINFHLRRKLHGQVFAALAASLRPAATAIEVQRLAYHAARAERWPEAFRFALQAGQMAWELFEVETARDYLEQAWNIASVHLPDLSQDDRLRCFEGLGDVYTTLGQFDDARKMFQDALDLPLVSARLHARVLLKIAEAYDHQGQLAAAAQWLEDALQALHADMEDALCAQICSQYSINRLKQGQITEAWTWAERACVTDSAQLHLLKAVLHRSSGEQERALGECDRAIALAKRPYNPVYLARGYTNRGVILSELNRWGEARQAHEEALATLATTHDMRIYAGAHCNLSDVCRHLGELESAQRLAETALHVATTLELHYEEALAHLNCGAALLEAGDPYRARTHHFEVAKRILQDHAIGQFRAEVERGIATAHLQAGRVSEAETAALAEIALATDPASPSPSDEGSGWRVLGDVRRTQARWQEAEEAFGRSIELLRQHGPKFELGLAYLDLARLLIDLERKDEAREASAAARPIFSEAGARLVLARVDTLDACLTDEIR
jgi:tetratricopeptide (TPR) repeat protein